MRCPSPTPRLGAPRPSGSPVPHLRPRSAGSSPIRQARDRSIPNPLLVAAIPDLGDLAFDDTEHLDAPYHSLIASAMANAPVTLGVLSDHTPQVVDHESSAMSGTDIRSARALGAVTSTPAVHKPHNVNAIREIIRPIVLSFLLSQR